MKRWFVGFSGVLLVVALVAAGCGSSKKSTTPKSGGGAKGGTLITVANAAPSGSPDPQVNYTLQEWQLLIFTHDGLVAFRRTGGKAGTKLVPDLAESIPKPTNGGKTWAFTLRKGIKFSNGKPLTGNDVKATFERLFKIGDSPNAGTWYNVIQGADACIKTPKTCDLSQGITVKGNIVTFKLTTADPEWLDKLAVPFAFILPASTAAKNLSIPPPGTGPYMWAQYAPNKQIKLVRNPDFKVWSADAQPAGNPDTIVQKFGLTVEAEVTQVENGQADWMFDQPPSDRLGEFSNKYASQVHVNPLTSTWYFAFNVNEKPFDNLKARQAVNYATDRAALVKIAGGPKLAVPTCQVLPPNFPGYVPYCPYTKNPSSGKWSAPDLVKAKALVAASGTKGASVKVNTDTTDTDKALGLYFVGLLNKLGYKASLQALSADIQYPYIQNSKNHVQFAFSDWFQDYPAASDFLNILLGCGSIHPNSNSSPNIAEFCDKGIQAQMDHAGQVGITDPTSANKIWAQIDHKVTDQAPWVAMYNPKYIDFLSKRVKGYLFSPQWYFLLDQASVK
ncbi:MAG: peptide/nickel transport system substrate-binding protein [Gaiellaceae bacterium]|nr:peptide/nickel transport system substrate-binding protein [Gaiellaceae bacterium]